MLYSALLGYAAVLIPAWITRYVSSWLFAVFGLQMFKEGKNVDQ